MQARKVQDLDLNLITKIYTSQTLPQLVIDGKINMGELIASPELFQHLVTIAFSKNHSTNKILLHYDIMGADHCKYIQTSLNKIPNNRIIISYLSHPMQLTPYQTQSNSLLSTNINVFNFDQTITMKSTFEEFRKEILYPVSPYLLGKQNAAFNARRGVEKIFKHDDNENMSAIVTSHNNSDFIAGYVAHILGKELTLISNAMFAQNYKPSIATYRISGYSKPFYILKMPLMLDMNKHLEVFHQFLIAQQCIQPSFYIDYYDSSRPNCTLALNLDFVSPHLVVVNDEGLNCLHAIIRPKNQILPRSNNINSITNTDSNKRKSPPPTIHAQDTKRQKSDINHTEIHIKIEPTEENSNFITETLPPENVDKQIVNLDLKTLYEVVKILRGNDNSMLNCPHLTKGIIDYFTTGIMPTKPASTEAASSDEFRIVINTQHCKIKNEFTPTGKNKSRTHITKSVINQNSLFSVPYDVHSNIQIEDDGQHSSLPDIVNLEQYTQKKADYMELNSVLKREADQHPVGVSFGFVCLGRCNHTPGHMLAYFATSDSVLYIDCQLLNGRTQQGQPLFDNLSYSYEFYSKGKVVTNNTFQALIFYTPINSGLLLEKEVTPTRKAIFG